MKTGSITYTLNLIKCIIIHVLYASFFLSYPILSSKRININDQEKSDKEAAFIPQEPINFLEEIDTKNIHADNIKKTQTKKFFPRRHKKKKKGLIRQGNGNTYFAKNQLNMRENSRVSHLHMGEKGDKIISSPTSSSLLPLQSSSQRRRKEESSSILRRPGEGSSPATLARSEHFSVIPNLLPTNEQALRKETRRDLFLPKYRVTLSDRSQIGIFHIGNSYYLPTRHIDEKGEEIQFIEKAHGWLREEDLLDKRISDDIHFFLHKFRKIQETREKIRDRKKSLDSFQTLKLTQFDDITLLENLYSLPKQALENIRKLNLKGSLYLTKAIIEIIFELLPYLKYVNLSEIEGIKAIEKEIKISHIPVKILKRLKEQHASGIVEPTHGHKMVFAPYLEELKLNRMKGLATLHLAAPNLKVLEMEDMEILQEISLDVPKIQYIDINSSTFMSNAVIKFIKKLILQEERKGLKHLSPYILIEAKGNSRISKLQFNKGLALYLQAELKNNFRGERDWSLPLCYLYQAGLNGHTLAQYIVGILALLKVNAELSLFYECSQFEIQGRHFLGEILGEQELDYLSDICPGDRFLIANRISQSRVKETGRIKEIIVDPEQGLEVWESIDNKELFRDPIILQQGVILENAGKWEEAIRVYCQETADREGLVYLSRMLTKGVLLPEDINLNQTQRYLVGLSVKSSKRLPYQALIKEAESTYVELIDINEVSIREVFFKIDRKWYSVLAIGKVVGGGEIDLTMSDNLHLIVERIKRLNNVICVSIRGCNLDDITLEQLLSALPCTVKSLELKENNITLINIGENFKNHLPTFEVLDLEKNWVDDEGCQLLASLFEKAKALRVLDLRYNKFSHQGKELLEDCWKNKEGLLILKEN